MDFVDWCGRVLQAMVHAWETSPQHHRGGVLTLRVAEMLFDPTVTHAPEFDQSTRYVAVKDALAQLAANRLVKDTYLVVTWRPETTAEDVVANRLPLWTSICETRVTGDRELLLRAVNRSSPREADDHAWVEWVDQSEIMATLGWRDRGHYWAVAEQLEDQRLVVTAVSDAIHLHATYRGLVWGTRRAFTIESHFIDELVAEWETANVEFKREVHTNMADDKAELIKDVLALANTQVTSQRWLIIGFDPKTHAYYGPPDPKLSQDHLEQLLSAYARPVPPIAYRVVAYRSGPVGQLEVQRQRRDLPYRVKLSVGDKKRISEGDVFVRHGSHTARADDEERADLEEERDWALRSERGAATEEA